MRPFDVLRRAVHPTETVPRTVVLAVAAAGFAVVFGLRIVVDDPDRPLSLLYAVPIAVVAVAFGAAGGLAAAVVALGLYAAWGLSGHTGGADDPVQYVLRSAAFLVVGGAVGLLADGLRRTVHMLHTQNVVADLLARADTLEHGLDRALAALARAGEWPAAAFWQREDGRARRRHMWAAPGVVVELPETRPWREPGQDVWDAAADAPPQLRRGVGVLVSADSDVIGAVEFYGCGANAVAADALRAVAAQIGLFVKRKAAEEELREARDEAERANRAKSDFLSRMSHELRTPLNAILGFGQLLQMDDLQPEQRESVDHIVKAGDHLLGLIDEVLDLARIEAGRLSLSVERVHLGTAVAEAVDVVRPLARERALSLVVHTETVDTWTMTDNQRLKQILLNLLSNAVKYNRHGGGIVVDAVPNGEWVRVRVADTGIGISDRALPQLFAPFVRGDADQSRIQGAGLGLALSKRLIELLGGAIGVETRPGEGSRFWIDVPAAAAPEEVEFEPAPDPPDGAVAERRIVYIEDNLANLKLVEQICANRPALQVLAAMQGTLGIDLARRHAPDVILLDLHLPDIPGDEVLTLLRGYEETRRVPVIVLTAESRDSVAARMKALGAFEILPKPLDVGDFLAVLDAALATAEAARGREPAEASAGR